MKSATMIDDDHATNASGDETCPTCHGVGRSPVAGARCSFCHGDGAVHRVLHATRGQDGRFPLHPGVRGLCDVRACRVARPALLSVGTRFWSEGLQATCRVLAIGERALRFVSEAAPAETIETEVPLDLVARHVAAGRWRVLPDTH